MWLCFYKTRRKRLMEFSTATNGETTCTENGFRLHSSYNPSKEAERFCNTLDCSFHPRYVLVTEPALSYCVPFLKKKFSNAILCCIRFSKEFESTNSSWDKIFYAYGKSQKTNPLLEEEIFNFMGDEGISACLFLSWKPSENPFKELYEFSWEEIKKTVLKSRSVLATRTFFSKRWAKNALRFSMFCKNTALIKNGTSDIVVCASGLSLKSDIPFLKKYRKRFFLIAVSSSLSPLIFNGITPDLCISTDGGYWAKLHLVPLCNSKKIPLALPGEASCFASILENTEIIPIFYGDGCSEKILKASGYSGHSAFRNGSVSGTAAYFSLSITSGKIFYCGLDLSFSKGFSHTQPNELEKRNSIFDNRTHTSETRNFSSEINTVSINIYKNWFSSNDFFGRIFRLSDNFKYDSELGTIKDVDWTFFEKQTFDFKSKTKPQIIDTQNIFNKEQRINFLRDIVIRNISNPEWIKNALPAETIALERCKNLCEKEKIEKRIQEGMKKFFCDIMKALGRNVAI